MAQDAFDFRELEARGFKPQARGVLEKAITRGKIFPQEISMLLSGATASDRQVVSKTVTWLAGELQRMNVTIATGKDAVDFKAEPVPQRNGFHAKAKVNGHHLNGVTLKKPNTGETQNKPEGEVSDEAVLETESEAYVDTGPVGPQELDEAEVAKMNLQMLEDQGSRVEFDALAQYYREVARFKLLTFEEEWQLGWQVKEKGDIAARKYAWSELPFEDLVQEGNIGLLVAADKYDYRVGRFTTYAMWWVRQRITRAIMDYGSLIRVPVHMQENRFKIVKAAGEVAFRTGRQPSLAEIAEETKLPVKNIQAIMLRTNLKVVSIDGPVFPAGSTRDSANATSYGDIMPDHMTLDGSYLIEARDELRQAQTRVANALNEIGTISGGREGSTTSRKAEIFNTFYGLDGTGQRRTLEETGEIHGVTRERIRQIIASVWNELAERGVDMDHDSFLQHMSSIEELSKLVKAAG